MSNQNTPAANVKRIDDISIGHLLLKLKEYCFLLIRKWWIILTLSLAWAAYDYYKTQKILPVYSGKVVLLLKPQDIAKESRSKVLIYARFANAKSVIQELLLEPISEDNSELLINYYIKTYFEKNPKGLPAHIPADYTFDQTVPALFSDLEKQIYKSIVGKLTTPIPGYADGFINVSINEALGLITMAIATPSEDLTFLILDKLKEKFKELSYSYATHAEEIAYLEFTEDADSLEQNYKAAYYELIKTRDRYQLYLETLKDPNDKKVRAMQRTIAKLEVDADVYKMNYLATLELMKHSQNNLNSRRPIIEVIEKTLPPITPFQPSPISAGIAGFIKGFLLSTFLIILYKVFSDILKEELG